MPVDEDGLGKLVNALPPSFTSRFGEVCWAAGGTYFFLSEDTQHYIVWLRKQLTDDTDVVKYVFLQPFFKVFRLALWYSEWIFRILRNSLLLCCCSSWKGHGFGWWVSFLPFLYSCWFPSDSIVVRVRYTHNLLSFKVLAIHGRSFKCIHSLPSFVVTVGTIFFIIECSQPSFTIRDSQ